MHFYSTDRYKNANGPKNVSEASAIMSQYLKKSPIVAITGKKKILIKCHKNTPYFVNAITFAQTNQ